MFAQWLSVFLLTIFILIIGFSVFSKYYESKPLIDIIEEQISVNDLVETINTIDNSRLHVNTMEVTSSQRLLAGVYIILI